MVPAEGLEPPTNGLQNRCSTAELSRPKTRVLAELIKPRKTLCFKMLFL